VRARIVVDALEKLRVHVGDASRRVEKAVTLGVITDGGE
jgi:hypothetical protein